MAVWSGNNYNHLSIRSPSNWYTLYMYIEICELGSSDCYSVVSYINNILAKKKFEDTKGVIGSCNSTDRQYNFQNKNTDTDLQNTTQKPKDWATRTPLKTSFLSCEIYPINRNDFIFTHHLTLPLASDFIVMVYNKNPRWILISPFMPPHIIVHIIAYIVSSGTYQIVAMMVW